MNSDQRDRLQRTLAPSTIGEIQECIYALRMARRRISKPGTWTQGAPARRCDGTGVSPFQAEAVCFCALGALDAQWHPLEDQPHLSGRLLARGALEAVLPLPLQCVVSDFNDLESTKHEDVLALYDRALKGCAAELRKLRKLRKLQQKKEK